MKTAGTSAGDTAKWLEEKTTEIGEAAGKLIASNPESKQAFQNGNVAKKTADDCTGDVAEKINSFKKENRRILCSRLENCFPLEVLYF